MRSKLPGAQRAGPKCLGEQTMTTRTLIQPEAIDGLGPYVLHSLEAEGGIARWMTYGVRDPESRRADFEAPTAPVMAVCRLREATFAGDVADQDMTEPRAVLTF